MATLSEVRRTIAGVLTCASRIVAGVNVAFTLCVFGLWLASARCDVHILQSGCPEVEPYEKLVIALSSLQVLMTVPAYAWLLYRAIWRMTAADVTWAAAGISASALLFWDFAYRTPSFLIWLLS